MFHFCISYIFFSRPSVRSYAPTLSITYANNFEKPRFSEENFSNNLALVDAVKIIADRKGITPGQLSLAWVHAQGSDVYPIPGTSSIEHLDENLAAATVTLSTEVILGR